MLNNLVYILIFTPIFSAIAIQFCANNKSVCQAVAFSSLFLMLAMSGMVIIESFDFAKSESNLSFDIISLPLEFNIDFILSVFTAIFIATKIIQLALFQGIFAKNLEIKALKTYFSSHLISCFAVIGVVVSNNLFNIFIFIELYFISYFALSYTCKNKKINYHISKQMILSIASSMLFLVSIIALYFHFETLDLSQLMPKIESGVDSFGLVKIACSLITISLLTRFIPLWVFFSKNIKDSVAISSELFFLLFVNLNILICILLKAYYIVFITNLMASIIVISCLVVIAYSSIVTMLNKHLRVQITLFCLGVFCFTVLSLALKNQSSFEASFFYIISYNIIALAIFSFVIFIWNNYNVSTMSDISALKRSGKFFDTGSHSLFTAIAALSIPLPHSPIFYANFLLFDAILDNNDDQLYEFSNFFDPYILIAILLFHISSLILFFKIIVSMAYPCKESPQSNSKNIKSNSFSFYLLGLMFLASLIYMLVGASEIRFVMDKFSKNLFNIL